MLIIISPEETNKEIILRPVRVQVGQVKRETAAR